MLCATARTRESILLSVYIVCMVYTLWEREPFKETPHFYVWMRKIRRFNENTLNYKGQEENVLTY